MQILIVCFCSFISLLSLYCIGMIDSVFGEPHSPETIAFASNVNGNWDIYLTDSVGQIPTNLTLNPAADYYPSWSPDGKQIAFFSNRDDNHEIYVMRSDGTDQRRLTHHPATDKAPCWAPNGMSITFSSNREGHYNIYTLDIKSGVVKNLTKSEFVDAIPTWSPDGKKVAFQSQRNFNWDIYTIEIGTHKEQRLTHQPLMDAYATWSPEGKHIVYCSMRQDVDQVDFDLYIMEAEGGGNKTALTDTQIDEAFPAFSPDGSSIVFQSEQNAKWVIHLMNADGSDRRVLINNDGWATQPKWKHSFIELPVNLLFLQFQQWGKLKTLSNHHKPN